MKKIPTILAIGFAIIGFGRCDLLPEESQEKTQPELIKTSSTENGIATFTDNSTG